MALDSKALNQYLQSDLIDMCQHAPQAALPQLPQFPQPPLSFSQGSLWHL